MSPSSAADWPACRRAAPWPRRATASSCSSGVRISVAARRRTNCPGTGEVVDNCQHVLLGCCTNLIDFYRRLGVEQQIRWYDEITFILPGGKSSTLKPGALPAPFHAAPSFLDSTVLDLKDKLAHCARHAGA